MKNKKEDKALRELFIKKLGNAEVIPDPSVKEQLMTRLGKREFLHFIPRKFNIWYAGILTAAATALALLLLTGRAKDNSADSLFSEESGTVIENTIKADQTVVSVVNPEQKTLRENPAAKRSAVSGSPDPKSMKEPESRSKSEIPGPSGPGSTYIPIVISGNRAFEGSLNRNELKESTLNETNPIITSSTEGCIPFRVNFRSAVIPVDSCLWTFGDGGSSSSDKPEWLFDQPGEYKVNLLVYSNNIRYSGSVIVIAHPSPEALFEIRPENAILPQDEIRFMNYSADGIKYVWSFGDGQSSDQFEPMHSYKRSGKYDVSLIVSSMFGCTDTMTIRNAFGGTEYYIDFPNAFIPNENGPTGGYYSNSSDQEASVFHPVFSGVSDYQLRIFSRRGLLIFESNDVSIGWDGYYRNQLCENGVYIWKLRGTFVNGETFTKMGDVTLLKK